MKKRVWSAQEIQTMLFERYPRIKNCEQDFSAAFSALLTCYLRGGKLLIAGNGGSAADSEHITGELMKSFLFMREAEHLTVENLRTIYGEEGNWLACRIEGALPAISLTSMPAVSTAFANDAESDATFAQMVYGLGRSEDVFWGLTTSGNSKNIVLALMMAKAKGMTTILLTGGDGGVCKKRADISICVCETETFKIQELHLPIYHALCAMLEAELFQEKS